jgi:hypothetical protein
MKNKLIQFIKSTNIYVLVPVPIFLGLLIIFLWGSLEQKIDPVIFNHGTTIVAIVSAGIMSLTGVFQIIKREAPGIPLKFPYRGIWAVISGVLWVTFCWGMIIFFVVSIIVSK